MGAIPIRDTRRFQFPSLNKNWLHSENNYSQPVDISNLCLTKNKNWWCGWQTATDKANQIKSFSNSIEGGNKKMYVKVKNSYGDTIVGYSVLLPFSGDGDGN